MVILLADEFSKDLPQRLSKFGEVTSDLARIGEVEVVIVRSKTKVDKAMIDKAPKLKFVIRGGVGVDTIDIDYAKSKGIEVDNTPEASTIAVAELAFAFIIALPNHIAAADASIREGKWLKKEMERTEVFGKTLGLIGLGRIARELALRAKAFGMKVVAYDKYLQTSDAATLVGLDELYARSDFISIHTPLTDETRGMLNKAALAKMKDKAFVINTCRGPVINTMDIVEALRSGKVAGYASDVFEVEPPGDSPLVKEPHTLFTPHIGASTAENLVRLGDCIVNRMTKYTSRK